MDLASGFPTPTRDDWLAVVDRDHATTTFDGVRIEPLYTADDVVVPDAYPGVAPYVRGANAAPGAWEIRQTHRMASGNRAVLTDLERGVDGLRLELGPDTTADELDELLDGVFLEMVSVHLVGGSAPALVELWERRGIQPSAAVGGFGVDPASAGAVEAARLAQPYPMVTAISVQGPSGASEAQELAATLAGAVAFLRAAEAEGIPIDEAVGTIEFTYSATVDQFLTIAKLRAARRLWARVTEQCGVQAPQRQHAITAASMVTRRDPWVNLLRTTVACFAAAVGGAEAITVRPFDAAIGASDELALRVARNTHLLLQEESHVAAAADPAGGSWYVEGLTDQLADAAWSLFQGLERGEALDLDAAWQDHASDRIVGVSEFPDLDEDPVERSGEPEVAGPRFAAPYEALRDAAEAAAEPPVIYVAELGPPAAFTARSVFARNLFAAGGIRGVSEGDYASSGARLAVIASSDKVYADQAADAARALKDAGCDYVYLAGKPDDGYRAAGVDAFVHLGSDRLAVLEDAHERLGLR